MFRESGWATYLKTLYAQCESWMTRHPILGALVGASAYVSVILTFFMLTYHDCDDVFILLMSKGVGLVQQPEIMNGRMNILLSYVLTSLYEWFPKIQWYSLMCVGTLFLSLWGMLLAVQSSGTQKIFKTTLWVFSGVIYTYFFMSMQWTMTASLAAMSAFFLFYVPYRDNKKTSWVVCFLSFFLMALSAGIRSDSFFLVCLLGVPSVLLFAREFEMTSERKKTLGIFLVLFFVTIAGISFDKLYYESKPEWSKAMSVFHAYFNLSEARGPVYSIETKPAFNSVGWTQNDLQLFKACYFLDDQNYSVEKINKLNGYFPRISANKRPKEGFKAMFGWLTTQCVLLTCLALLFLIPHREVHIAIFDVIWTAVVLVFLWLAFKIPERVYLPCLIFLMNLLLFRAIPNNWKDKLGKSVGISDKWRNMVVLTLILVFSYSFVLASKKADRAWREYQGAFQTTIKSFHPEKDKLYVIWEMAFPYNLIWPFDDYEMFRGWNIVSLTWLQRFPVTQRMLDRFGVKDLFRDMVDNPNILLICEISRAELYQTYLYEKYGLKTDLTATYVSNFFCVFEIHLSPEGKSRVASKI